MKFIFYADNVQQYMRALQRKFVMLHIIYRAQSDNLIVPISFKEYIEKIYALCSSQFLKN